MREFQLNDYEYIELNKLLKLLKLVGSGGEANAMIVDKEVMVNGAVETQKRKKLRKGDKVEFNGESIVIV
jgi:ribosome-associated protein